MIPQRSLSLLSNRLARGGAPRDLYDTWFLVSGGHVEARELKEAVGEKLAFRSRSLADTAGVFAGKEARLEKLWETRLRDQMTDLPEFGAGPDRERVGVAAVR